MAEKRALSVFKVQKLREWAAMIEACRKSGMAVADWCAEHRMTTRMYYYRHAAVMKRLEEVGTVQEQGVTFAEIPYRKLPGRQTEQASGMIIVRTGTASDINIGNISSDVDKNTATRAPAVIIPPEYRLDAAAEKPHCGTTPIKPPTRGPSLPALSIADCVLVSLLCSNHSMIR